jgi:regulatory protein
MISSMDTAMISPEDNKILSRLQRLCSRMEYCSSDMYSKAVKALTGDRRDLSETDRKAISEKAAQMVASLVGEKYIDDSRYACAFAREKAALSGWGKVKIGFMLRGKGISQDHIDVALSGIDSDDAAERLGKLVAAKYRTLQGDPQCKLKLLKYALGRGYEYDAVEAVVDRVMKGDDI